MSTTTYQIILVFIGILVLVIKKRSLKLAILNSLLVVLFPLLTMGRLIEIFPSLVTNTSLFLFLEAVLFPMYIILVSGHIWSNKSFFRKYG